jgi:hypothetical protein
MGRFLLGSTVILLLPAGGHRLESGCVPGAACAWVSSWRPEGHGRLLAFFLDAGDDPPIARQARRVDPAVFRRGRSRRSPALPRGGSRGTGTRRRSRNLPEAFAAHRRGQVPEAELADARRVDQGAAGRQGEEPGRGGRVAALAALRDSSPIRCSCAGRSALSEGALADARLPDEDTRVSRQGSRSAAGHAFAGTPRVPGSRGPGRAPKASSRAAAGPRSSSRSVLLRKQHRLGAEVFRGHEVAVDQVGVRFGQRGDHDHHAVDVRGDGAQLAELVRALQRRARGCTATTTPSSPVAVSGAEDHAVAGDRRLEVGAQVAAVSPCRPRRAGRTCWPYCAITVPAPPTEARRSPPLPLPPRRPAAPRCALVLLGDAPALLVD